MPRTYQQNGIQLLYPENWEVVDEQPQADPPSVTLQSPGTGYWNLTIYPDSHDPEELVQKTVAAMREEYAALESEPITCSFGQQLAAGFHMEFYCLDFIINARALALRTASQTLLFIFQAEDNEFNELEPIFAALTISVLEHLGGQENKSHPDSLSAQPPV